MNQPELASQIALSVRNLRVSYRDASGKSFTALSLAELDLQSGAMLGITGPSGSGKSTLLYALAGLGENQTGNIAWGDVQLDRLPSTARDRWRRKTVGFVFQDFNLVAELSPLENVLLPAYFSRLSAPPALRQRARYLLERFGVPVSRSVTGHLSRGEQQRVALARALLFDPPVILADEPTASLDTDAAHLVIETLEGLARDEGRIVICVSHDKALVERCAPVLRLDHGAAAEPARNAA